MIRIFFFSFFLWILFPFSPNACPWHSFTKLIPVGYQSGKLVCLRIDKEYELGDDYSHYKASVLEEEFNFEQKRKIIDTLFKDTILEAETLGILIKRVFMEKQKKYQNELGFKPLIHRTYKALFTSGDQYIRISEDTINYLHKLTYKKDTFPLFELLDSTSTAYRFSGRYFIHKQGDWHPAPFIISYSIYETAKKKRFLLVTFGDSSGEGSEFPMDEKMIQYYNSSFKPKVNDMPFYEGGMSHLINFDLLFFL